MKTIQTLPQQALECPKCGKHTIVEPSPNVYQCLNCDFRRDISEQSSSSSETPPDTMAGLVATCLVMLFILMLL